MEDQTNGPATSVREEGALELAESKSMKPYMSLTIAMIQGRDVATALREIASLPLEERYVWRIASALNWLLSISTRQAFARISSRCPLQIWPRFASW